MTDIIPRDQNHSKAPMSTRQGTSAELKEGQGEF